MEDFNFEYVDWMFHMAINFNQDISSWDVSNVVGMSVMFDKAESFNSDISNWDVSNVRRMSFMFKFTDSFNRDLSIWNVSSVEFCEDFDLGADNWTLPKPNFTNCVP